MAPSPPQRHPPDPRQQQRPQGWLSYFPSLFFLAAAALFGFAMIHNRTNTSSSSSSSSSSNSLLAIKTDRHQQPLGEEKEIDKALARIRQELMVEKKAHAEDEELVGLLTKEVTVSEALKKKKEEEIEALQKAAEDCAKQAKDGADIKVLRKRVKELEATLAARALDGGGSSSSNSSTTTNSTTTTKGGNSSLPMVMPAWTTHHRFYVLGGVLTRDQIDERLYLDLALAGRKMFLLKSAVIGVDELDEEWSFGKTHNVADPDEVVRGKGKIYCRVKKEGGEEEEEVEAVVVPVHTSVDPNVNGNTHILRCPVPDAKPQTEGEVDVTFRVVYGNKPTEDAVEYGWAWPGEEGEEEKEERFRVVVPRATRLAGYFSHMPEASKLDPWQAEPDMIHLCVSGMHSDFTCPLLDLTLEFIEYHLQQGIGHMHFGFDYPLGSENWEAVLRVLRPYIDEKKVSVVSTQSLQGPGWVGGDQYKLYFYNECLAYTKGLATWVGVWDIDEFLVPREKKKAEKKTIVQALEGVLAKEGKKAEELCYLRMTSYSHIHSDYGEEHKAGNKSWVGLMYGNWREVESDDTWQKCLLSNRNTYFTGFHMPGACREAGGRDWKVPVGWEKEAVHVDREVMAMQHYRNKLYGGSGSLKTPVVEEDEYGKIYFPEVLERLKERKTAKIVEKECGYRPVMTLDYVGGPTEEEKEQARKVVRGWEKEEERR